MITEETRELIEEDIYCLKSIAHLEKVRKQFYTDDIDGGILDRYVKIKTRKLGKELIELISEVLHLLEDTYTSDEEIRKIRTLFEGYNGKPFDVESTLRFEKEINDLIEELEDTYTSDEEIS